MLKKLFVVCLVVLLIQTACLPDLHAQSPIEQQRKALEFREKTGKWDVGKEVTIKTLDGNTFKGPIAQITDDGLIVLDKDRGRVSVSYIGVKSVKAERSRLFKTMVGVGAAFGALLIVSAAMCMNTDRCN